MDTKLATLTVDHSKVNRNFGAFQISEADLRANIIEKERITLIHRDEDLLKLDGLSEIEIIEKLYLINCPKSLSYYGDKRSKSRADGISKYEAPFFLKKKVFVPSMLLAVDVLCVWVLWMLWQNPFALNPAHSPNGYFLAILITVFCGLAMLGTLVGAGIGYYRVYVDTKLARELQQDISNRKESIENSLADFNDKLDNDKVFYLNHLLSELEHQKSLQKNRVLNIDQEFRSLVEEPREQSRKEIQSIWNQIRQTKRLEEYLPADEIKNLRSNMRDKVKVQIAAIRRLSPMESKIVQKRDSINKRFAAMEAGIANLMDFRDSFKDLDTIINDIRSTINTEVIDWGYVQQAHYDRTLIKILDDFTEVEDELQQLTVVANEVGGLLPPAPERKVLAAVG